MPRELRKAPQWYSVGSQEPITAGEFYQETVKAGSEVTLWDKQVNQDQVLFHGHGPEDREFAEAFVGLDLVATGNGDGTDGAEVNGRIVLAITDSDQRRVLADTTFDTVGQLRASLAEDRTSQKIENALGPYAKPGRYLEIRIEADSASDGYEVDPVDSSGTMYYTKVTN